MLLSIRPYVNAEFVSVEIIYRRWWPLKSRRVAYGTLNPNAPRSPYSVTGPQWYWRDSREPLSRKHNRQLRTLLRDFTAACEPPYWDGSAVGHKP
jgi:hypothetical protein